MSTQKNGLQKKGHPRGMLGKKHNPNSWTSESRKKLSEHARENIIKRIQKNPKTVYSRGRKGTRSDLGFYLRSSWEANFARYLNLLKAENKIYHWEYESDLLELLHENKIITYIPDFKVWEKQNSEPIYYEVKGWLDNKSKLKLKLMNEQFPHISIILIDENKFKELETIKDRIPNWEETKIHDDGSANKLATVSIKHVEQIKKMLLDNPKITQREIAKELQLSTSRICQLMKYVDKTND